MRKLISLLLFCCAIALIAQEKASNFTGRDENQPRNPRMDQMNYVPDEIIVKFKDETSISTARKIKAAGISKVDEVLQKYEITELERLFPQEKKPARMKVMRAPNGSELKVPALDKIYRVSVPKTEAPLAHPVNIHQIIEELQALPEVEYAEPNYIYTIDQMQPVGPELTAEEVARMQSNRQAAKSDAVVPNDPLYPEQWYIPAVKADLVWEQTTGDSTQVIAILDTGVDWTHPDLKNKIWRNPGEIEGNGRDDDSNGFIDDYMGWDFINNDNNPMDDNSHGTHVAGIAAAEANNGIGIAGVNWHAKIMPIKVFQSSGYGDAATITQGIIYATRKGATVINMSFGSYARSFTMENALLNAYPECMLVAAAGNDGRDIESRMPLGRHYPAAIPYVLGVMSPEAIFSNSDKNGPTFSTYDELNNYELNAPGTDIISTIPNGNYRVYQGTSMAAPLVSGALSLYRNLMSYDDESNEFMWVKLIQSTGQYLNIHKALTFNPDPEIWFLDKMLVDTLGTADRDGRVDAGEHIQLWFRARNTGGQVDSVYWKIQLAEFEDTTTCQIIKPTSYLGSISPYATRTSEDDPMELYISPNVAHDRDITFDLLSWYKEATDTLVQKFVLTIENGVEMSGIIMKDTVLSTDKFWLLNRSLRISENVKVTVKPGTKLEISTSIDNRGFFDFSGTADSLIYVRFKNGGRLEGNCNYSYVDVIVDGVYDGVWADNVNNSVIYRGTNNIALSENNLFKDVHYVDTKNSFNDFYNRCFAVYSFQLDTCILYQSGDFGESYDLYHSSFNVYDRIFRRLLFVGNVVNEYVNKNKNSFLNVGGIVSTTGSDSYVNFPNQYWGSNNEQIIKTKYRDFNDYSLFPYLNIEPKLDHPSELCHAHVWKVLLNGKDAQDEYIDPIGLGKHRFDVYFNRPMDKTITPQVSFGVREPYNQQAVNEDGEWSEDGKIYTVYKTIKLTTGDGINRIRVAGAKEIDGWDFEIPVEDSRFEFVISAASSASLEFMATPGLGKVALEWNDNDLEDGLGYNMYRMEHINDSTLTNPILINNSLITDTLYTDFSVIPNKRYYYYYKILRTNMAETDSSRVVSAVPFTASKGDANGDLSVNVLDITTIVAYLLNNNPQPFIFDAADVNEDGQINVLDIVGVVNLVLGVPQHAPGIAMSKQVDLYLRNDTLFADSNVDIGALQLDLIGIDKFSEIEVLDALKDFESGNSYANGNLRVIFYSMSGKSIEPGQAIPLLKLKAGAVVNEVIVGEPNESNVKVNYIKTRIPDIAANMNQTVAELGQNYPNPVNGFTTIPVRIYEAVDEVVLRVVNMMGQEIESIRLTNPVVGENLIQWNPKQHQGVMMYKLEIRQGVSRSVCPARKMVVQ